MTVKLEEAVQRVRDGVHVSKLETLEKTLEINAVEHNTYHDWHARAQANGLVSVDTAHWIHARLGPIWSPSNGGWPPDVDTATKVVVSHFIGLIAKVLQAKNLVPA